MTLNRRVMLITAILTMTVFSVGVASAIILTKLVNAQTDSHVSTEALRNHLEADMMHDALRSQVYQSLESVRAGNSDGIKAVRAEFDEHQRWFTKKIDENKALSLPENVKAALAKVDAPLRAYISEGSGLISEIEAGREVSHQQLEHFGENFSSLETALRETSDGIEKAVAGNWDTVESLVNMLMILMLAGGAILCGAAWYVRLMLRGNIVQPIERLTQSLGQLSAGELDVEITDRDRDDEIGMLAKGVEAFKLAIRESRDANQQASELREVQSAREQQRASMLELAKRFEDTVGTIVGSVAVASTQLQTTATSMAATAEQASKQTTDVSGALNEASAGVTAAAAASDEFAMSIGEIGKQAATSAELARMAAVAAGEADTTISELQLAAGQVSQIVALISSIAQRTNLLALNASIEAARGGEAGRGFAVVASEVKDLAAQTSKATEEVSQHIRTMQETTNASVGALRAIGKQIDQVEAASVSIAAAVDQQSVSGVDLARSIDLAARSTDEVASNIVSVRETSLATGAAASQVLMSSVELGAQADSLRTQVDDFLNHVRAA